MKSTMHILIIPVLLLVSFSVQGQGTFKASDRAHPSKGEKGKRETLSEVKIEVIAPRYLSNSIVENARKIHPYEEMAFEIIALSNHHQSIGSGMIGELEHPMEIREFLAYIKKNLNTEVIKYTPYNTKIRKVAVCGGSGSFLINRAIRAGADAMISSDLKYHEYFDALENLMLCDIGHYESEISCLELFHEVIQQKNPNFAVIFCETNTNPVKYFI